MFPRHFGEDYHLSMPAINSSSCSRRVEADEMHCHAFGKRVLVDEQGQQQKESSEPSGSHRIT
jgi:hypothetical protein